MSARYLLNCWYVAAWAGELPLGECMRRVLLGKPVLLMRGEDGNVAAIGNVCPHRFASLSEGRFEGNQIECPYHGLRFDMSGRCVMNPHGDGKIPGRARVPCYPVAERHGAVWIWLGRAESADPTLIPDFSFLDPLSVKGSAGGYLPIGANYQLMCDNLLDLSHSDFLHRTTLGTGGDIARCRPKVDLDGDVVTVSWSFDGRGMVMNRSGENTANMRTEFAVTWYAPGAIIIRSESRRIDDTAFKSEIACGHNRISAHIVTPETEHTCHYFFNTTEEGGVKLGAQIFKMEDAVALEDVQGNMGGSELWDLSPLILSSDAGGVSARRVLQRKIRREQERNGQPRQSD